MGLFTSSGGRAATSFSPAFRPFEKEDGRELNISVQAVGKNCRAGKYVGAFQDPISGRWYIPVDTTKTVSISPAKIRRKKRPLKATDDEWEKIAERAAMTKYSVNDYIIRAALGKSVDK